VTDGVACVLDLLDMACQEGRYLDMLQSLFVQGRAYCRVCMCVWHTTTQPQRGTLPKMWIGHRPG
jgi:hypothetical protein